MDKIRKNRDADSQYGRSLKVVKLPSELCESSLVQQRRKEELVSPVNGP
ncbi:MAG: hypothetical protein ACFCBU_04185 [Cyanophyceae cyanobacterium]